MPQDLFEGLADKGPRPAVSSPYPDVGPAVQSQAAHEAEIQVLRMKWCDEVEYLGDTLQEALDNIASLERLYARAIDRIGTLERITDERIAECNRLLEENRKLKREAA